MRIKIMQALEVVFEAIASAAEKMRERCAVCSCCGQNRYSGPPCVTFNSEEEAN